MNDENSLMQALVANSKLGKYVINTPEVSRGSFDDFANSTKVYRPQTG